MPPDDPAIAARIAANALLNGMRPKTARPAARYDLATAIGIAMGLDAAGHRAKALEVLAKARADGKAAGVAKKLDGLIAAVGSAGKG